MYTVKKFKTQGRKSIKKLKDSANFGVKLQQKSTEMTKNKGEATNIPKSRTKHSKHYRMGTILNQKY